MLVRSLKVKLSLISIKKKKIPSELLWVKYRIEISEYQHKSENNT